MEIVHKFKLVYVRKDEGSHCARLRLRERIRSGERLCARVLLQSKITVRESIVTVQVDACESFVATEPFPSPRVIFILPLQNVVGCLEEGLLDVEDAVDVEDRHEVDGDLLEKVGVVLVIMDNAVQEFVDNVEWHLDRNSFTSMMSTSK